MGWCGVLVLEDNGGVDMGHSGARVASWELSKALAESPFLITVVMALKALMQLDSTASTERLSAISEGHLSYVLALDQTSKIVPKKSQLACKRARDFV